MKHYIIAVLTLMISWNMAIAAVSTGDIYISVVQPERAEVPQEAAKLLETKMHQMITAQGVADTDPNGRFVITVRSNVITKDIVGGAPQRLSQKIDFTFIIGDAVENKVYETCTLTSIGIGINENKSYINAISKIKPNSPSFVTFIDHAKEKILRYYSARCEQIVLEAKQQAANRDYQQAIYMLMQVPNICDCAETCQTLMVEYYDAHTEMTAASLLNEAKSVWASSPNAVGAPQVANLIRQIPANTSVQSELNTLITEINQKLREDEKREWDFQMRQYNDQIARQKREFQLRKQQQEANNMARTQSIEACRQVGLAYARNYQPPTYYVRNVVLW